MVDDCAISGSRFGEFLPDCGSQEVVFAHLYSHPDLRAAVERREPAVTACVGARDLHDHAPGRLGAEYEGWRERWAARGSGYWIGQPDYVVFPWNEPDVALWNPLSERVERGWRLVPPELCIKNRAEARQPLVPIEVQEEGPGPLGLGPGVLSVGREERVVVGSAYTGETFALEGAAAGMWRALVHHGEPGPAAAALLEEYEVPEERLRTDFEELAEALLSRGLLERA